MLPADVQDLGLVRALVARDPVDSVDRGRVEAQSRRREKLPVPRVLRRAVVAAVRNRNIRRPRKAR